MPAPDDAANHAAPAAQLQQLAPYRLDGDGIGALHAHLRRPAAGGEHDVVGLEDAAAVGDGHAAARRRGDIERAAFLDDLDAARHAAATPRRSARRRRRAMQG